MKRLNIYERRLHVLSFIYYNKSFVTFDYIVCKTSYSRSETAHHLAILEKQKKVKKNNTSEGLMYEVVEDEIIDDICYEFNREAFDEVDFSSDD